MPVVVQHQAATCRVNDTEITVFDSTGIAIEDAAAAVYVVEKALAREWEGKFRF